MPPHRLYPAVWLPMIALAVVAGCQERPRQAVTQPAARPTAQHAAPSPLKDNTAATSQKTLDEPAAPPPKTEPPKTEPPKSSKPKRPVDSWVIFRAAFEPAEDAACSAKWTGGNRLEVHTENVKRITIDMRLLPEGAPTKGPWNLQIDGQGIEITGFKPKPGYTGKIRDLVRSKNGNWTVDRKALYRIRG